MSGCRRMEELAKGKEFSRFRGCIYESVSDIRNGGVFKADDEADERGRGGQFEASATGLQGRGCEGLDVRTHSGRPESDLEVWVDAGIPNTYSLFPE